MQTLAGVVAGIAALGIGFGLGTIQKKQFSSGAPGDRSVADTGAITFEGGGPPQSESGGGETDDQTMFPGVIPYTTFAEAAPRLDELLNDYEKLGRWERNNAPVKGELILEDVEAIFALASETELIEFIRNFKIERETWSIGEIAFASFAKISPARAAAFWLEHSEELKESAPLVTLRSVFRVWAKQNPAAVERWVENLEEVGQRKMARDIYLTMIAASNPQKVLAELSEPTPANGEGIAMILGQTMEEDRLAATAAGFLEKDENGSNLIEMLGPFLGVWGQRNSDEMMAWIFAQDPGVISHESIRNSLTGIAYAEPEKFLEGIPPTFSTSSELQGVAGLAWWKWLTTDGSESSAFLWLTRNQEMGANFSGWEIADRAVNSTDWSPARATRVLDALATLPDSDFKAKFSQDFFERLSRFQPEAVLPYAMEQLPLGSRSDSTISRIVGNWARSGEAEEAIQWSLEYLDGENSQSGALRFAFGCWAEKDGPAAAGFAMTLPDELRSSALSGLSYQWADKDPEGLISFLGKVEDPVSVSILTRNAFREFSENKSGAKYFQQALEMPPGRLRHDAVKGLFGGWALSDAKAAVDSISKVPEGSLRNNAIQGFNSFAARRDPALAIKLAIQISNEGARDKELIFRGKNWMKANPKEAEKAIRGNASISNKVKSEIFK